MTHVFAGVKLSPVLQQHEQRLPADDAAHLKGLGVRLAGPRAERVGLHRDTRIGF